MGCHRLGEIHGVEISSRGRFHEQEVFQGGWGCGGRGFVVKGNSYPYHHGNTSLAVERKVRLCVETLQCGESGQPPYSMRMSIPTSSAQPSPQPKTLYSPKCPHLSRQPSSVRRTLSITQRAGRIFSSTSRSDEHFNEIQFNSIQSIISRISQDDSRPAALITTRY